MKRHRRAAQSGYETPGREEEFTTVILDDFTIYRQNNGTHPNVMRPLSDLLTRGGDRAYLFDGIIRIDDVEHRIHGVPFSILSLDGYGSDAVTISNKIWIQSPLAQQYNIWYHLKRPAKEYARYHVPFQWLADFSKHFVAYLDYREELKDVRLHDFRSNFYTWLQGQHGSNKTFQSWHEMYDFKEDFRTVIAANFEFLWKESVTVQEENRECFLWKEVDSKALSAVPLQPLKVHNTIVTPYVYKCFRKMYFASAMECRAPISEVQRASSTRSKAFASRANLSEVLEGHDDRPHTAAITNEVIRPGDVVQLEKDENGPWGGPAEWYAYVQSVEARKSGNVLRVIWLYWPEQTTCANMTYSYRQELFFSDHCNCGDHPISTSEVLRKVKVKFGKDQDSEKNYDFFVRQTYKTISNNPSWETFNRSHFKCPCREKAKEIEYSYGQTVLVSEVTKGLLEPVIVLEKPTGGYYKARRLMRRKRDYGDAHARDNELVWSEEKIWIKTRDIKRVCNIRQYSHEDVLHHRVPAPYSYNGTGDCWILTTITSEAGNLESISADQIEMIEGFDPESTTGRVPLKGCSLFCGGGSFDRGFEESGAVQFTHSVDWAQPAIHTCRANAEDPDKLNLFYGNVNDWLARLLQGDTSAVIPQVGSIGFMTAGSPCVAFSMLQPDKMSESSLRNASLVAALATAIDVLRPEYGVFENVFAMGNMCGDDKKENVLSQMICCFVGMGYQVQIVNQDAHSTGSGEQRSRLLICIAAPGLVPLDRPPITHAHPEGTKRRVIGRAPNGESFGERIMDLTPFELNTCQDVIGDLPDIGDGKVNICIPFPDHRVSADKRYENWLKIKHIPRFPHGCSWTSAVSMGYMPKPIIDNIQRKSKLWNGAANKAFGRLYPDKSMPTVITVVTPDCAMNGRALHYDQPRVMTVMEARRAQSYPDHEVLIGLPSDQWRIVGNSVDRKVSVAAGVSLRQAWMANDNYQPFVDQFQRGGSHTAVNDEVIPVEQEDIAVAVNEDIEAAALLNSAVAPTTLYKGALSKPAASRRIVTSTEPILPRKALAPMPTALPRPSVTSVKAVASRKSITATRLDAPTRPDDDSDLIVVKRTSTTKRIFSGDASQTSQKTVKSSSRHSLPSELVYARSMPRQSDVPHEQKTSKLAPRQSLPVKLIEQTRNSRQSSDELGESLSTPIIPAVHPPPSRPISNPFAKYRARERSPTTGAFLPRTSTINSTQRPPAISTHQLPFVKTINGMVSPPTTSEERSPVVEEPSLSFADIAQMPRTDEDVDEDEDELSIHVDNALAVTSTAGLGLPDGNVKEIVALSGHDGVVMQGDDLMEWELTG